MVCIDYYKEGFTGVLMQEGKVMCYGSRKLNKHEDDYVTHDVELVSIIHALNMLRHYLLGRKFMLMLDHIGVKYFFGQPKFFFLIGRLKIIGFKFLHNVKV